ncbi:MAG: TGS domain-containing protein [Firmicutes bacterium]|nr:TGS domain-containing protein [Bacillota bacterium]
MKILLKKGPRQEFEEMMVEKGTTIEEICKKIESELPYTVLAAKVNNRIERLTESLHGESEVELLDMRTQQANLIYQNSLCMIYLKAIEDVMGNVEVDIENSLNKGLYTEIKGPQAVSAKDIKNIQNRMWELVDADIPIEEEKLTREEAIAQFEKMGCEEKITLLCQDKRRHSFPFYSLDGYKDFFYGLMVPSTGYIRHFQLVKYKRGVLLRFPHPSKPDVIPEYVDEKMLYQTFGEQSRWGKLMGINYVSDLNRKIEEGKFKELIQLSEALHEKRIVEIANMIVKQKKRIVLIAGPSSSGKTTFAQRLCIQLRVNGLQPLYMGTDDYFVERDETPLDEYGEKDYENLQAVDIHLFNQNINDLLSGKTVDMPSFNFLTGKKEYGRRITSIKGNQPIVIEGIHALNEKLTEELPQDEKFKIYISPLTQLNIDSHNRVVTTDHRMLRRMVRDFKYRGHSAQSTIANWPKVRAGEDKNIFPYSNEADVLFNSVHLYEISVLKKYAQPLLEAITPEEPEYSDAVRMLEFLRFFKTVEDDSAIVNNSILREFIGGSIFVE